MKPLCTLIAIGAQGDGWVEIELLHRRRWPFRDRREVLRLAGVNIVYRWPMA